MPRSHRTILALSLLIMLPVTAAEYSVQPILGITTEISDNQRLLTDNFNPETTIGARTFVQADFLMLTEDISIELTPRLSVNRYSEDIGLNTENKYIDLAVTHLITEKHQISLNAGYRDEAITTAQTIVDPVTLSVAGLTFDEITQETLNVSPSYTYSFDERTQFSASYGYTDATFNDTLNRFIDYTFQNWSLSATRVLTEKDTVTAQVYRTDFDRPDIRSNTINNAFQIFYNRDFTPSFRASIGGGMTFAESETTFNTLFGPVTVDNSEAGELISMEVQKEFESTTLTAGFDRQVTPTSLGDQRVTDDFTATINNRFSERFSGALSIRYIENEEAFTQNSQIRGSEYFSITSSLSYKLLPNILLAGGYVYSTVEDIGVSNERDSNRFFFTLQYSPEKFIFQQ